MNKIRIFLVLLTSLYIISIFNRISLTGELTDIIFCLVLMTSLIIVFFKYRNKRKWITVLIKGFVFLFSFSTILFILISLRLEIPNRTETQNYYYKELNGRYFNVYLYHSHFSGCEDRYSITESSKFFPFVELTLDEGNDNRYDLEPINPNSTHEERNSKIIKYYLDKYIFMKGK